jgi:hypothetical protein
VLGALYKLSDFEISAVSTLALASKKLVLRTASPREAHLRQYPNAGRERPDSEPNRLSGKAALRHRATLAHARISSKKFSIAFHERSSDSLLYLSAGRPRLSASGLVKLWTVPP